MSSSEFPSLNQIREAHSWKRDYERFMPLSRYVYRPIGLLLTWLLIRLGLTSEMVSWFSGLAGILGLFCLLGHDIQTIWIGVGLLIFFNLLDCVDGSIARTMKTENPYGKFLDSVIGDVVNYAFWGIVGVMTYKHPNMLYGTLGFVSKTLWGLSMGCSCAFFYILLRQIEQQYEQITTQHVDIACRQTSKDSDNRKKLSSDFIKNKAEASWKSILRLIDRNLRVRETQYFFLIIGILLDVVDIFLLVYLIYFLLRTIASFIVYVLRIKRIRDELLL